jgi:hypothetical protein
VQLSHQLPLAAPQLRPVRRPAAGRSTHDTSIQLHFSADKLVARREGVCCCGRWLPRALEVASL